MTKGSKKALSVREMAIFAMLGTVMFITKVLMEWLPNIHPLALLTVTYTIVYRKKALIPIYIYVVLNGAFAGFNVWWVPYIYIWTILWGAAMLLPQNMPAKVAAPVYMALCAVHGALFGLMYAPAQALFFGLSLKGTITWVIAGLPYDLIHAAGNLVLGALIVPLAALLKKMDSGAVRE